VTDLGLLQLRDPDSLLKQVQHEWTGSGSGDLWVFGYASLIWRPEFEFVEERCATVHGWHRALKMRSRINRGTPECPGLVFALVSGGSCRGMAYRVARERVEAELPLLWQREMPTGVYDPKWLSCKTSQGTVKALSFTLSRASPSYIESVDEDNMLAILRTACGRYGSTLDYLVRTSDSLQRCGIRDREIERLVALARRHALIEA
jgi:cation transport protein ChaC